MERTRRPPRAAVVLGLKIGVILAGGWSCVVGLEGAARSAAASAPAPAPAATPTIASLGDARAIMEEVDRRHRTERQYSEGNVTVEEKGTVRKKAWRSWRLGWGNRVKSLVQFLEPPEVKGVTLLTLNHPDRPDEQWFYAPAVDRDRRVARQEKATRFLGTHFTYEDFEERDLDDYDYRLLDEPTVDGVLCWRIESIPRPRKESQYSKLVFWIRKDQLTTIKIEGYVEGGLRRTFRASNLETVDGIVTPRDWEVVDEKRGGRTHLEVRNLRYRVDIDESILALQGMRVLHEPPR